MHTGAQGTAYPEDASLSRECWPIQRMLTHMRIPCSTCLDRVRALTYTLIQSVVLLLAVVDRNWHLEGDELQEVRAERG